MAQEITQHPSIDFIFRYSPIMDATIFRYLLPLGVQNCLETTILDVVIAYYGNLNATIYIRPPFDFLSTPPPLDTPGKHSGLKLQRALYGLKQASRMWYKHLRDFLIYHKFQHDPTLPCIFTLRMLTVL